MRKCVFLSMDDMEGYPVDDRLVFEPLKKLGWDACEISWHNPDVAWDRFDLVVIRSTWDYQYLFDDYLACLKKIEQSKTRLANSYETVCWNVDKTYLNDLARQGVETVPTIWKESVDNAAMLDAFETFNSERIIVKPTVSASAHDTFLVEKDDFDLMAKIEATAEGRSFMIQPFIASVIEEGEYSLMLLGGEYSHAVIKRPKSGDFRVQEQHGGSNEVVRPEELLVEKAQQAVDSVPEAPLYARADFVRQGSRFLLMELELIEPSLYLDFDLKAPERFAAAIAKLGL